ncbi:MAG: tetratricopeptide repeat protein [Candidatus Omnitrophota bacterium]
MKTTLIIVIAAFAVMTIAANVDAYRQHFLIDKGVYSLDHDVMYRMFGEFRSFLSDMSYLEADVYFHGGMYHMHDEGEKNCLTTLASDRQAPDSDETAHHHHHHHHHAESAVSENPLLRIGQAIDITEHRHLSGKDSKEVLPWIYYAVKLNPHNITAYDTGAYWLASRLGQPEKALDLLRDGINNNPESWALNRTAGVIYYDQKDYRNAIKHLEQSVRLGEAEHYDKFDRRTVYVPLAECYDKTGSPDKALKLYERVLKDFPGNESVLNKISYFESRLKQ